jgi:hypothetical protein
MSMSDMWPVWKHNKVGWYFDHHISNMIVWRQFCIYVHAPPIVVLYHR